MFTHPTASPTITPPPSISPAPTPAPTPAVWFMGDVTCGARVEDDNTNAADIGGHGGPEHVWNFKPQGWGYVRFSTCGSQFDTYLNIYENATMSFCGDDDNGYYYNGGYYFYGYGGDDTCSSTSYYWNGYDDLSGHDSSKCREYSCGSHDGDCCGYDYETWCADGYTLVRGNQGEHDCWPGQKGYRCLPNGGYDDDYDYSGGNYAYNDGYDDDDGMCCEPDEYHYDWDEAYDMCESTGMRQIYARDDDGSDRCDYNWNPNNADEYTHGCCATDIEVYMHGDRNYWISVTGARNNARPKRAPAHKEREPPFRRASPNARVLRKRLRARRLRRERGQRPLPPERLLRARRRRRVPRRQRRRPVVGRIRDVRLLVLHTGRRVQLLRLHVQLL